MQGGNLQRFGSMQIFAPIYYNTKSVLYLPINLRANTHKDFIGSLGMGARRLFSNSIGGVYYAFDAKKLATETFAMRHTAGLEWILQQYEFRISAYLPTKQYLASPKVSTKVQHNFSQDDNQTTTEITQDTFKNTLPKGFDVSITFVSRDNNLRTTATYYHWFAKNLNIHGAKINASIPINSWINLVGQLQYDQTFGANYHAGAALVYRFSKGISYPIQSLYHKMSQLYFRDIDILSVEEKQASTTETINTEGRQLLIVETGASVEGNMVFNSDNIQQLDLEQELTNIKFIPDNQIVSIINEANNSFNYPVLASFLDFLQQQGLSLDQLLDRKSDLADALIANHLATGQTDATNQAIIHFDNLSLPTNIYPVHVPESPALEGQVRPSYTRMVNNPLADFHAAYSAELGLPKAPVLLPHNITREGIVLSGSANKPGAIEAGLTSILMSVKLEDYMAKRWLRNIRANPDHFLSPLGLPLDTEVMLVVQNSPWGTLTGLQLKGQPWVHPDIIPPQESQEEITAHSYMYKQIEPTIGTGKLLNLAAIIPAGTTPGEEDLSIDAEKDIPGASIPSNIASTADALAFEPDTGFFNIDSTVSGILGLSIINSGQKSAITLHATLLRAEQQQFQRVMLPADSEFSLQALLSSIQTDTDIAGDEFGEILQGFAARATAIMDGTLA